MNNNDNNVFDDAIETALKIALAPIKILARDVMQTKKPNPHMEQGEYEQKKMSPRGGKEERGKTSAFNTGGGEKEEKESYQEETSTEEIAYRLWQIEAIEKTVAEAFARDKDDIHSQVQEYKSEVLAEAMLNAIQETIQEIQNLYEESCISYPR